MDPEVLTRRSAHTHARTQLHTHRHTPLSHSHARAYTLIHAICKYKLVGDTDIFFFQLKLDVFSIHLYNSRNMWVFRSGVKSLELRDEY